MKRSLPALSAGPAFKEEVRTIIIIFAATQLVLGCTPKTQECEPEGVPQSQPETAREYVAMCEPELGVPPEFDCASGVTLPITVNGVDVPRTCCLVV